MPVITFESGKLTKEQKAQLAQEFTEAAHKITGIRKEAFVVLLHENERENIATGGVLLADK